MIPLLLIIVIISAAPLPLNTNNVKKFNAKTDKAPKIPIRPQSLHRATSLHSVSSQQTIKTSNTASAKKNVWDEQFEKFQNYQKFGKDLKDLEEKKFLQIMENLYIPNPSEENADQNVGCLNGLCGDFSLDDVFSYFRSTHW